MPVYTVHAPVTRSSGLAATDGFAFVRDGFHVWAALLGVVWLAWHRLWLALIGWIVLMAVIDFAMMRLGVSTRFDRIWRNNGSPRPMTRQNNHAL